MVLLNLHAEAKLVRAFSMAFRPNNSNGTLESQLWERHSGKLERSSQRLLVARDIEDAHQLLAVREFFAAISKESSDADVARYHRYSFGLACHRLLDNVPREA